MKTNSLLRIISAVFAVIILISCGHKDDPAVPDTTKPVVTLTFSNLTYNSVTLTFSATDNVGVKTCELDSNSNYLSSNPTSPLVVNNLKPNRSYTFLYKAIDGAGNIGQSTITVTTPTFASQFTAVIDASKSYEASATATDKVLYGRSIAKAFVVYATTAGTANLETVGTTTSGGNPIGYFWINSSDNSDLNAAASTLSSIVPKTAISASQTINLTAGYNVICFKTTAYSSSITNGTKVGLKITGKDFTYTNDSYTADGSMNVAAVQKMKYFNGSNYVAPASKEINNDIWSVFELFPYNDESANIYDGTLYPKILSYSVDISNTSWISPSTGYTNLDFTNAHGTGGKNFSLKQLPGTTGIPLSVLFDNTQYSFSSNVLQFSSINGSQIVKSSMGNYAYLEVFTNVYNNGSTQFGPAAVCWYHKSVHYLGNPENWIIDPSGNRIQ